MNCKVSMRQAGDVLILDLAGPVTLGEGTRQVRDAIKKLVESGARYILLNFQDISYLDSAGLGELVSAYTSVTKAGGQIKLMHVQNLVKQLLQVTKLCTVFTTYEDEKLALRSF
jgi:anti-sigma B factor antagonist